MTQSKSNQVDQSQAFNCSGCPNFTSFNGSRGRGLCQYRDQVVFEHHQSTNECLYSLEKKSKQYLQSFEQPEDIPYCEFQPGQLVKVIDLDEPNHNEWATFKIFTKIINYKRFSSSGSYLEPDWLIASLKVKSIKSKVKSFVHSTFGLSIEFKTPTKIKD